MPREWPQCYYKVLKRKAGDVKRFDLCTTVGCNEQQLFDWNAETYWDPKLCEGQVYFDAWTKDPAAALKKGARGIKIRGQEHEALENPISNGSIGQLPKFSIYTAASVEGGVQPFFTINSCTGGRGTEASAAAKELIASMQAEAIDDVNAAALDFVGTHAAAVAGDADAAAALQMAGDAADVASARDTSAAADASVIGDVAAAANAAAPTAHNPAPRGGAAFTHYETWDEQCVEGGKDAIRRFMYYNHPEAEKKMPAKYMTDPYTATSFRVRTVSSSDQCCADGAIRAPTLLKALSDLSSDPVR